MQILESLDFWNRDIFLILLSAYLLENTGRNIIPCANILLFRYQDI